MGRRGRCTGSRTPRPARCATRWTRRSQFDALKAIEDAGEELVAIYHSHTKSAAYPSQTDVNQAVAWPEQIYLIVSLADEDAPDVKGFWLRDGRIAEAELDRRVRAGWSRSPSPRTRSRRK